jgi:hypothetical protein
MRGEQAGRATPAARRPGGGGAQAGAHAERPVAPHCSGGKSHGARKAQWNVASRRVTKK